MTEPGAPERRLRQRREALGLSFAGLAARAGLSRGHVFSLETGRAKVENLSVVNACALAASLQLTLMELIRD